MVESGYNVNTGAYDNNRARDDMLRSGASMHLLMTSIRDGNKILNFYKEKLPAQQLAVRIYDPREGNRSLYDNHEVIREWKEVGHFDVLHDDPCNEPSLDADNQALNTDYVQRSVELLRLAKEAGIRVAVGAFSVGTPHEEMIWNGTYDPLLRAIADGNHAISVHEYAPGVPGPGDWLEPEVLHDVKSLWAKVQALTWPLDDHMWFVRRSDRFEIRRQKLGLPFIGIAVFESPVDNTYSIIDDILRQHYDTPEYDNLRGILSWRRFYEDLLPATAFDEAVYRIMRYRREVVYKVPHIIADCFFTLSKNAPWGTVGGYNFGDPQLDRFRTVMLPAINSIELETEPMPAPDPVPTIPDWQETIFDFNGNHLRHFPNLGGAIITTLTGHARLGQLDINGAKENDGYYWFHIKISGVDGWIAWYKLGASGDTFFTMKVPEPDPLPEPQPEPVPAPDDTDKEKQRQLARAVIMALVAIASAIALYFGINFNPPVPNFDPTPSAETITVAP